MIFYFAWGCSSGNAFARGKKAERGSPVAAAGETL
jgi:hypothetical protein